MADCMRFPSSHRLPTSRLSGVVRGPSRRAAYALLVPCWIGLAPTGAAQDVAPPGEWPLFRGCAAQSGVAAGELRLPLEPAWSFETGKAIVSSPVVGAGRVVFGCDDGHVYCLDAASGEQRWSFDTGDIVEAPAALADGRCFVGSSSGLFLALDLTSGKELWRRETDDKILGGANLVRVGEETLVVVGSYDSNLYAFSAADGTPRWKYATENYVNGTPAITDGRIVFGGCDAVLHVVSPADGSAREKIALGSDAHVAGSVALAGERVYFGHYGNAFVCADLARGELLWSFPDPKQPFFSSPALAGQRVVFGGRNKKLQCVDAQSGELLWSFASRRKVDGSPVVVGDQVVIAGADGRLSVLGLEDGRERWFRDLGSEVGSSVAVAGGRVYVTTLDGRALAFASAGAGTGPPPGGQAEIREDTREKGTE